MLILQKTNLFCYASQISRRAFVTAAKINVETSPEDARTAIEKDWENVKPFESMPGPTKLQLISAFLPGGAFYNVPQIELNRRLRQRYGDIFRIPSVFGKRPMVFTANPKDFEAVYRTEGVYPERHGFEVIEYYRKVYRKDIFGKCEGLVSGQGHDWGVMRSTVNPVLMNPKTTKIYVSRMSQVVDEFMEIIKKSRDPKTNEVQDNFQEQLNIWAMESVSLVALDTRLGLMDESSGSELQAKAKSFIRNASEFFDLMFEFESKVSLWKYYHTREFKRLLSVLDMLTEFAKTSVGKAMERLQIEETKGLETPDDERSVLERLTKLNPEIGLVMALDMVIAGVDTTSSAVTGCLANLAKNPEKQAKLREEVFRILPQKDSVLTQESMKNLPYLRASIKESLRIFPVASGNFRTTGQDVILSGYRVPKGMDVVMPNQLLLRDAKYFPRPDDFLPERFLRDTSAAAEAKVCPAHRNRESAFVALPFGFGPRVCVGRRIVDLEMEVLLLKLLRNFEIRFDYSTDDLFKSTLINVPNKPLKFKFTDL